MKSLLIGKPFIAALIIFTLGVGLDQITKQWSRKELLSDTFHAHTDDYPACGNLQEEIRRARFIHQTGTPKSVIANFFTFRYVENCSAAFNLMGSIPESVRFPFFLLISLVACVLIPYMYLKTPLNQIFMLHALPFILSGAIGNLLDRLIYRYVIDFIDWYVVIDGKEYHWPTFNIADALIVAGIGLMIIQMIIGDKTPDTASPKTPDTATPNAE